jgi:solute carrier family 35 protein C2
MQHNGAFGMYSGLKNPLTLMSYVTPVMAISTGLLSLVLDPWHEFNKTSYFNNSWHVAWSCLLMFFGGTLAFFMVQAFPFLFILNLSFFGVF